MITIDEIKKIAKLMKIDLEDYGEHVEKIQTMIGYFERLDTVELPDTFRRGLTVEIDSLRDDTPEPSGFDVGPGLKFRGGEHVRSPKLR